jgi:predicted metal-binding membrane protein
MRMADMEAVATTHTPQVRALDLVIPAGLLAGAAVGWWWSVRMAADMNSIGTDGSMGGMTSMAATHTMSMAAYVVGWVAMMAAMMFPAIAPMVKLYAKAAAKGHVAPVPFFVAGYLIVWSAVGFPTYFVWRELAGPLADGAAWVGRLAGFTLVTAGIYQFTPLKSVCLAHCRSPISFFIKHSGSTTDTPYRAARLGAGHGAFCLGCCWAIMAVLVTLGTMNLVWMALLAAVIFVEKVTPWGETFAMVAAVGFALVGTALIVDPTNITALT